MTQGQANLSPCWRELAAETAKEQDPAKLVEKVQELIKALDVEEEKKKPAETVILVKEEKAKVKRAG